MNVQTGEIYSKQDPESHRRMVEALSKGEEVVELDDRDAERLFKQSRPERRAFYRDLKRRRNQHKHNQ